MMTESRKNTLHAMLLEAFFRMSSCAYGGFIVTMLTDYGYSSATATALMTCMAAVSFIAQPITGYLCDNYFSQRIALLQQVKGWCPADCQVSQRAAGPGRLPGSPELRGPVDPQKAADRFW